MFKINDKIWINYEQIKFMFMIRNFNIKYPNIINKISFKI